MRLPLLLAALAMPVMAAPAWSSEPQVAAAEDWTGTVARTEAGGYRIGNPDATVQLVEFVSMTCGHCAHFHHEGMSPLLAGYVATGQVSLEMRNFVLNLPDMIASSVARCSAEPRFFDVTAALLEKQDEWTGAFRRVDKEKGQALVDAKDLHGLAQMGGVAGIALDGDAGVGADALRECMNELSVVDELLAMRRTAHQEHGVSSTPSFLINDRLVPVHDWSSLKPLIDKALAE
ncbi:DsbA family protein [Sphingomicrobium lutaoense]|uniref:Protein-disulfide isomerase n=1 Tax=Sphingomicrobium lutaoense TaxID=515949 RepID=A0A839Z6V0_9SPHN|nr:thioredoxin domain-containing protein [Sphingomicrobium lutaoense]MBB3764474.1 protein-disulfide isomerase [Sphingomicrobium lutaoense]